MDHRHKALIVEDESNMAAEIGDLVRSLGHDHVIVGNKVDALVNLDEQVFCYILLDLQINSDADSIKPHVFVGMSLLADIRRRFPHRGMNDKHMLPVIVVSGHAKEHDDVVRALQAGASDFIRKPFSVGGENLDVKIRRVLELSGRADHGSCSQQTIAAANGHAATAPKIEQVFWHLADYSEIHHKGTVYLFTGRVQQNVMKLLHAASLSPNPWLSGKVTLTKAGSTDAAMKMRNLFGRHPCWATLLISDTRGRYRIQTT